MTEHRETDGMAHALIRISRAVIERNIGDVYGEASELYRAAPADTIDSEQEVLHLASTAAHNAGMAVYIDRLTPGAGDAFWRFAAGALARAVPQMRASERNRNLDELCSECPSRPLCGDCPARPCSDCDQQDHAR